MGPREEARLKARELLKKVDFCVQGDINPMSAKDMVGIIIDEVLNTNPTIKGTSDDLCTMIVQTKAHWYLIKEELEKL